MTAINEDLVAGLVADQFPQWSTLGVTAIAPGGWDNRSFRIGSDLLARLPSHARYAAQVEREQRWLPALAARLPLPIPSPVALGQPGRGYAWRWSIFRWIEGESLSSASVTDNALLARDLASFLRALYRIDAGEGPRAGEHNFFRGGPVATYDAEVRAALPHLSDPVRRAAATAVWQAALASSWNAPGVWVHGDVAAGNLLARDGRLTAVIDFGSSGVGDPACDLTIAWTYFHGAGRRAFRRAMALSDDTWARARGWALWKALIVAFEGDGSSPAARDARRVLEEILSPAETTA